MTSPRPAGRLRTWLQLLRAPNLFTVPGDPLAGYLLASAGFVEGGLWRAILASLCFYCAGLLMNDLVDLEEDRRERPSRPLPSGAATPGAVRAGVAFFVLLGMSVLLYAHRTPAWVTGFVLIWAIFFYNRVTKGWPVIGALNMGLCRASSVMLGGFMGSPWGWQLAMPVALLFGLYIAAVTNLARHETRDRVPVVARLLPAIVALLACLSGSWQAGMSPEKAWAIGLFAIVAVAAGLLAWRMFRHPSPPLPPMIGAHIRLLLPLQAAIVWMADPYEVGRWSALVLLSLAGLPAGLPALLRQLSAPPKEGIRNFGIDSTAPHRILSPPASCRRNCSSSILPPSARSASLSCRNSIRRRASFPR